jgi:hypothetical protein
MLLLVSTSDKLQVVTSSAGIIDVHASWMDNIAGSVAPGRTNTNISTAATIDVVASPAASTQRNIKTLHIRNRGIANNTITIQHTDGTTVSQLYRTALVPEQTLQYIDEIGFVAPPITPVTVSTLTGDVKFTLKNVADTGWVMMNDGTLGDTTSGSTTRANSDTQDLFTLLFNNTADAACPLYTAGTTTVALRSAYSNNPLTAFNAHTQIALPKTLGRALAGAGSGATLTLRALGATFGEEKHTQTVAELATHSHVMGYLSVYETTGIGNAIFGPTPASTNTGQTGSSTPFNVMQPTTFLNVMIKL